VDNIQIKPIYQGECKSGLAMPNRFFYAEKAMPKGKNQFMNTYHQCCQENLLANHLYGPNPVFTRLLLFSAIF
jgi:hypothetical protein